MAKRERDTSSLVAKLRELVEDLSEIGSERIRRARKLMAKLREKGAGAIQKVTPKSEPVQSSRRKKAA
jgi:hypothetical protein